MNFGEQANSTPDRNGDQASPVVEAPDRPTVDGAPLLAQGGTTKADLRRIDRDGVSMVVKDFAHKSWWVRTWGRIQVSRECRAYRWLGPTRGIPRFVGRVDRYALAIEYVEGAALGFTPLRFEQGAVLLRRLERVLGRCHAAGLVHLDARARENVWVRADGEVFLLDLAGAVWLRPGGWWHARLFRWLQTVDRSALLKWKDTLDAGEYTDEERAFLARHRRLRDLWIFNRRHRRALRGE